MPISSLKLNISALSVVKNLFHSLYYSDLHARLNAEINTPGNFIYISEQKVRECFGKNGALLCQLKLRVCGDVQTAEQVFNDNGLILDIEQHTELNQTFFVLRPEKNTMTCEDLS